MVGVVFIILLAVFVNFSFKKARLIREEGYAGIAPLVGFGGLAIAVVAFIAMLPVVQYISQP